MHSAQILPFTGKVKRGRIRASRSEPSMGDIALYHRERDGLQVDRVASLADYRTEPGNVELALALALFCALGPIAREAAQTQLLHLRYLSGDARGREAAQRALDIIGRPPAKGTGL